MEFRVSGKRDLCKKLAPWVEKGGAKVLGEWRQGVKKTFTGDKG